MMIKNQIERLEELMVGVREKQIKITPVKSTRKKDVLIDHIFNIEFDIGDKSKSWQVIFDTQELPNAPDFVFDGDEDTFSPNIDIIKSYWHPDQLSSLKDIFGEFYKLYVIHEHHHFKNYPKLYSEWIDFCKIKTHNTIEISVTKNGPGTYNDTVTLIIPIDINYSQLPPCLSSDDLGEAKSFLHLSFSTPNQTAVTAKLEVSSLLKYHLGDFSSLRIPTYGTTTLSKYVIKITNLLMSTIDFISERFRKRRAFINTCRAMFYGSLVEFDTNFYFDACFLSAVENCHFLLYVVLGDDFPTEKPMLCIQKVDIDNDSMDKSFLKDYPYTHSKSNEENVTIIRSYLIQYVKQTFD